MTKKELFEIRSGLDELKRLISELEYLVLDMTDDEHDDFVRTMKTLMEVKTRKMTGPERKKYLDELCDLKFMS